MKYISLEEFNDAPSLVKDKILAWWIPEKGDLVSLAKLPSMSCVAFTNEKTVHVAAGFYMTANEKKENVIPLLTIDKLIAFIEDTTKCRVNICRNINNYINVIVYNPSTSDVLHQAHYKEVDMLHALWQFVLKISVII